MSAPLTELELQEARDLAAEMDFSPEHRLGLCAWIVRARRVVHMLRLQRWRKHTSYQVVAAADEVPDTQREAERQHDQQSEEHRP